MLDQNRAVQAAMFLHPPPASRSAAIAVPDGAQSGSVEVEIKDSAKGHHIWTTVVNESAAATMNRMRDQRSGDA